jgi:trk system potassium uptake protein
VTTRHTREHWRGRFAPYVLGVGLLGVALLCLVFGVYALAVNEPALGFGVALTVALGVALPLLAFGSKDAKPTRRETMIAVSLLWLVITAVGAIPYALSGGMSVVNAVFESASGFTATGATALDHFHSFPASMFMYRAMTQWLGGVGIIVLFIAVLPQLAIAGRQLFFAEMTGPTDERLSPRLRQTASGVALVYLALTLGCFTAYQLAGMSTFDALAHTFTTVGAAGFSTRAESFVAYAPQIEWVAITFMFMAGISFALYVRATRGRVLGLWRNRELRAYVVIIALFTLLVALSLRDLYEPGEALRHSLFQVISILTTTGYASQDYDQWPQRTQAFLVALMFVGGSAGSAAGGIKIVRWLIIGKNTTREIRRTLHPRAVVPIHLGSVQIPEDVLRAVAAFVTLFVTLTALLTLALAWFGADLTTAFTAAVACLGNVGPGLNMVGPMQTYSGLHPVSQVLLSLAMIAGRLEILTLFVALDRRFWRLPRLPIWAR